MLAACDKAKREEATASVLDAMVKLVGQCVSDDLLHPTEGMRVFTYREVHGRDVILWRGD